MNDEWTRRAADRDRRGHEWALILADALLGGNVTFALSTMANRIVAASPAGNPQPAMAALAGQAKAPSAASRPTASAHGSGADGVTFRGS